MLRIYFTYHSIIRCNVILKSGYILKGNNKMDCTAVTQVFSTFERFLFVQVFISLGVSPSQSPERQSIVRRLIDSAPSQPPKHPVQSETFHSSLHTLKLDFTNELRISFENLTE